MKTYGTSRTKGSYTNTSEQNKKRYYGDLQWYAPDGIDGDKKDTLLIIAVKVNNSKLIEWVLGLDGLDPMKKNGKGMTAMAVAKALGRENLLLGIAETESGETETSSGVKSMAVGALPPPPGTAVGGAELEIARLSQAVKMLKVTLIFVYLVAIDSAPALRLFTLTFKVIDWIFLVFDSSYWQILQQYSIIAYYKLAIKSRRNLDIVAAMPSPSPR